MICFILFCWPHPFLALGPNVVRSMRNEIGSTGRPLELFEEFIEFAVILLTVPSKAWTFSSVGLSLSSMILACWLPGCTQKLHARLHKMVRKGCTKGCTPGDTKGLHTRLHDRLHNRLHKLPQGCVQDAAENYGQIPEDAV